MVKTLQVSWREQIKQENECKKNNNGEICKPKTLHSKKNKKLLMHLLMSRSACSRDRIRQINNNLVQNMLISYEVEVVSTLQ